MHQWSEVESESSQIRVLRPWRRPFPFRERRKERFSELEATLDQIDSQLQGERTENAELAARNEALQVRAMPQSLKILQMHLRQGAAALEPFGLIPSASQG